MALLTPVISGSGFLAGHHTRGAAGEKYDLASGQAAVKSPALESRPTSRPPSQSSIASSAERATLTVIGIIVAITSFGLLRTIVDAWYAGANASSAARLVTRSSVSLVFSLPLNYAQKIRQVPGVTSVAWANWFGGVAIAGGLLDHEPLRGMAREALSSKGVKMMEEILDPVSGALALAREP